MQASDVFAATIRRKAPVTPQVTPQVGTKLALSRHQVDILHKCRIDTPLQVLMKITGRFDRTKFRNQVLNPLMKDDLIEMTTPERKASSACYSGKCGQVKRLMAELGREGMVSLQGKGRGARWIYLGSDNE